MIVPYPTNNVDNVGFLDITFAKAKQFIKGVGSFTNVMTCLNKLKICLILNLI